MAIILEENLTLEELNVPGFHKVVRAQDKSRGLDAIIAIHDLRLGKSALGGTRIREYLSFEDALSDATRLAKSMTYKSAAVQAGWGGGKSVINADPHRDKNKNLLSAFGEVINKLEGMYICAEDSGCSTKDVAVIAETTPYVVGLPHEKSSGNPSPFTAWGVFRGIQAVMHQLFGSDSVEKKTIAIQGLGSVGSHLAELLFWHGANIVVTDLHFERAEALAKQFGGKAVAPEEIYEVPCDVFAPCAMGGIINAETIDKLRCCAIAGAANNQLLTPSDAEELRRLGILYAPDFVINAGGLINVTEETTKEGYRPFSARSKVNGLYDQLKLVFNVAKKNGISTEKAVKQLLDYRIEHGIGRRVDPVYMHHAGICF